MTTITNLASFLSPPPPSNVTNLINSAHENSTAAAAAISAGDVTTAIDNLVKSSTAFISAASNLGVESNLGETLLLLGNNHAKSAKSLSLVVSKRNKETEKIMDVVGDDTKLTDERDKMRLNNLYSIRAAVRDGMKKIHESGEDSLSASAFMNMGLGGSHMRGSPPSSPTRLGASSTRLGASSTSIASPTRGGSVGVGLGGSVIGGKMRQHHLFNSNKINNTRGSAHTSPAGAGTRTINFNNENVIDAMMELELELEKIDAKRGGTGVWEGSGVGTGDHFGSSSLAASAFFSASNKSIKSSNLDESFYVVPKKRSENLPLNSGGKPMQHNMNTIEQQHHRHNQQQQQQRHHQQQQQPFSPEQFSQLLASYNRLITENANLLIKAQEGEKYRIEAQELRERMESFKDEYGKRFQSMKGALDNFRRRNGDGGDLGDSGVILSSEYLKAVDKDKKGKVAQLEKLLERERAEMAKKDKALKKYEDFYREIKTRTKAKRQEESASGKARVGLPSGKGGGLNLMQQQQQQRHKPT